MWSLTGLLLSALGGLSSSSITLFWLSMELSMLSFLVYLFYSSDKKSLNFSKYFIIQSFGSLLLMTSLALLSAGLGGESIFSGMSVALLLKVGVPPFHSWFVSLMSDLRWDALWALSTLQKVLPFYLLMHLASWITPVLVILSLSVGTVGLYFQLRLKKIMAYSSIVGGSWVLASSPYFMTGALYLVVYSLGLLVWVTSVGRNSSTMSVELNQSYKASLSVGVLFTSLLSMAGFPPLLGFYTKVLVLSASVVSGHILLAFSLLLLAPLSLVAYVRIALLDLKVSKANWAFKASFYSFSSSLSVVSGALILAGLALFL